MQRTERRPSVTISYAQTLDGRAATFGGGSRWISCPDSLLFAHEMRAEHDAVLVGSGTVRADDPRLTVRLAGGRDPLRVVAATTLRVPATSNLVSNGAASGTVFASTDLAPPARRDALRARGATVLSLPRSAEDRVDLPAMLDALYGLGVRSVMVEGGATLVTALLRERLVDRAAVCVAPKILGSGIDAVGDLGIRELSRSLLLVDTSVSQRGVDVILTGRVVYPDAG